MTTRRALPLHDRIRIASPCDVPWEDMRGDAHVRHCDRCDRNVYDLSSLTRAEVERLFDAHPDVPCVSYFRRSDGTILLADCPVGVSRRRRRWLAFSALAVGTLAGVAGLFAASTTEAAEVTPEPVPGENTPAALRRPDLPVVPLVLPAPTSPPPSASSSPARLTRPPAPTASPPGSMDWSRVQGGAY